MGLADRAMDIAFDVHFDHRNKHDGEVYLRHLHRVYLDVKNRGLDDVHQAVAWLHDSVEDWPDRISIGDIIEAFPAFPEIAAAVQAISKVKGESNLAYYNRLILTPIAARVKVSDLHDNFRRNHLITDDATRARMAAKYSLGQDVLSDFR